VRRFWKRALSLGLVAGAATASALVVAAPVAHAAHTDVIAAAGSDTTEDLMDNILNGANEVNIHANVPGTTYTVPADGTNCSSSFTYSGAVNNPTSPTIVAPNGSGAGRDALKNSVSGTTGNFPAPGGFGKGCIDIARSSGEPRGVPSDNSTFNYYAFALDNVTWASPSLAAPATMTVQNLRDIFNCTITNWAQLPGGGVGQIQRVIPQASSGTGATFINKVLGGAAPPVAGRPQNTTDFGPLDLGCPALINTAQENHGNDPTFKTGAVYQQAIVPYSSGKWSFQAQNSANPTLDIRNGVRIGGLTISGTAAYGVSWNGFDFFPNSAVTNETNPNLQNPNDVSVFPGVRYLYNVLDSTEPEISTALSLVGFDQVGNKSPLCTAVGQPGSKATTILSQGFLNLAGQTVGGTTNVSCRKDPIGNPLLSETINLAVSGTNNETVTQATQVPLGGGVDLHFSVHFSAAITPVNLPLAAIQLSGSSTGATVTATTPLPASPNGQDFDVTVHATHTGTVAAIVLANQVQDAGAHQNAASSSTSNTVIVT
jgi:phosphate transport system substrate-binding protein